jgi:hypothetical protein
MGIAFGCWAFFALAAGDFRLFLEELQTALEWWLIYLVLDIKGSFQKEERE